MASEVCVVLPAAGTGQRFGDELPKQFQIVSNRPLLCFTVEAFQKIQWVSKIVLTISQDWHLYVEELVKLYNYSKVVLAEGKDTRHRSIFEGIKVARKECPAVEVIVVHDVVRPFVEESFLRSVSEAAREQQAAGCTRPLVSTVVAVTSENLLDHSLDRSKYRASEMPQAFKADVIEQAFQRCSEWDFDNGTECLHLVKKYCEVTPKLFPGPDNLWKVTYRQDLIAASYLIKERNHAVYIVEQGDSKVKICFEDALLDQLKAHSWVTYTDKDAKDLKTVWDQMKAVIVFHTGPQPPSQPCSDLVTTLHHNLGIILYIHVLHDHGSHQADSESFRSWIKKLSKCPDVTGVPVNGVIYEQSGSREDLMKLVLALLKDRCQAYTGQTFVID